MNIVFVDRMKEIDRENSIYMLNKKGCLKLASLFIYFNRILFDLIAHVYKIYGDFITTISCRRL